MARPFIGKVRTATQWIYVMAEQQSLEALPFADGKVKTADTDIKTGGWKPPHQSPAGLPPPGQELDAGRHTRSLK